MPPNFEEGLDTIEITPSWRLHRARCHCSTSTGNSGLQLSLSSRGTRSCVRDFICFGFCCGARSWARIECFYSFFCVPWWLERAIRGCDFLVPFTHTRSVGRKSGCTIRYTTHGGLGWRCREQSRNKHNHYYTRSDAAITTRRMMVSMNLSSQK